jgi:tRNA(Ile)-lysidine synthase
MVEELKRVLREKCHLDPGKNVLAGISGGPDSLCLLDLLQQLDYQVVVAHLNHKLRPEADAEAQFVRSFAEKAGFQVVISVCDVRDYAGAHSLSVEEAGRVLRYRFLFDKAREFGAQAVAVGHNADDQAETVLMHITRGSGLAGLRGMRYFTLPNPWSEQIPLVRPLLGVWREGIESYLSERKIEPAIDPSNLDTAYARNRLRHELIPTLETYNPAVRMALWRLGQVAGEDYALLEEYTGSEWSQLVSQQGEGFIAIHLQNIKEASLGMQRNLLRRAIATLLGDVRDIDYAAVKRVTDYLSTPAQSGECELKGGLKMFAEGDLLWLVTGDAQLPTQDWPQIAPGAVLDVGVPGRTALPGDWMVSCEIVEMSEDLRALIYCNSDHLQAWIDIDGLSSPLQIRSRAAGDRFQPLGMANGSMKLSDFMVNNRLPERLRKGWPLLCAGDDILWVPGYRINHRYRVTGQSGRVLSLRCEKSGE